MEKETGTVIKWVTDRGFGFIRADASPQGPAIFVHQSEIRMSGFRELYQHQRVEFEVKQGEKGLCAVNVIVLEDQQAAAGG